MSEKQSLCHDHCHDETHHEGHDHHDHDHDHVNDHDHDHDHHDHDHHDHEIQLLEPQQDLQLIQFIMQSSDFKQAAVLALLYLALAIQALWYGLTSSSVHLTEESFDCGLNAIIIGFAIYCGIKAKSFKQTTTFPFAMERLEYLSAFTLCIHICILTMFQLSRNGHEILEDLNVIKHPDSDSHQSNSNNELYYATLRIVLSFIGIFLFVEYIQPNFTPDKEQLQQFSYNFKNLIPFQTQKYYYTHYLNMHAITMLLLCELLFNIGTFLECMLDNALSIAAIGTIIAATYTFIIIIQLTPLVQTSIQALLLATNDKFDGIKYSVNQLYVWNHGSDYNAIIITQSPNRRAKREEVKEMVSSKFKNCYIHVQ